MLVRCATFGVSRSNAVSRSLRLLPPTGILPRGIDEAGVLVAGEAELDEPFAVEVLGHLFQYLDPPQVVLDQVVVGREDGGDFALSVNRRERNLQRLKDFLI